MKTHRFTMTPKPPFRLDLTVWVLRRRPVNRMDIWDGKTYRRAITIDGLTALVAVKQQGSPDCPELLVKVEGENVSGDSENSVIEALKRLLGTDIDLAGFYGLADGDPDLASLADMFRGMRPPRYITLFEAVANGIIGQQISLYAAINILNRFSEAYGQPFTHSGEKFHAFPEPGDLAGCNLEDIKKVGLTVNKARALVEAARMIAAGTPSLHELEAMDYASASEYLEKLRGIGPWTADYILLRGLGRIDIFPRNDAGALKALANWLHSRESLSPPSDLKAAANHDLFQNALPKWRPYAGLVYFHLLLKGLHEEGLIV